MKIIAVTYENGQVFQHFGHTNQFKIYTTENNTVTSSEIIDTNGQGHGALAVFLKKLNTDTLICGGIGAGAQQALAEVNIKVYGGVTGEADACVDEFLRGTLNYNPNVQCSHHSHEEGHNCSSGGHSCSSSQIQPEFKLIK